MRRNIIDPATLWLWAIMLLTAGLMSGCLRPIEQPPSAIKAKVTATPMNDVQQHPDIIAAQITRAADGTYTLAVTVSSPYDSPERYADGWRVLTADGTVLGEHTLLHDHANEQPFTRTQRGVTIPAGVEEVTIEGRDQSYGYGGRTLTVAVPQ